MESIGCSDYGFACSYDVSGTPDDVIIGYKKHMNDEHGIEYTNEAIKEIIKRKNENKISQ